MNFLNLIQNPIFNAIFQGILVYIVIIIGNNIDPDLGAILYSFPYGLFILLALLKSKQKDFISSAVWVNFIDTLMWLIIFLTYIFITKDIKILCIVGFISWIILGLLYYFYIKFIKK